MQTPIECQQVPEGMRSVTHPLAHTPSRRLPDPQSARLPASPTRWLDCVNSFRDFPRRYRQAENKDSLKKTTSTRQQKSYVNSEHDEDLNERQGKYFLPRSPCLTHRDTDTGVMPCAANTPAFCPPLNRADGPSAPSADRKPASPRRQLKNILPPLYPLREGQNSKQIGSLNDAAF